MIRSPELTKLRTFEYHYTFQNIFSGFYLFAEFLFNFENSGHSKIERVDSFENLRVIVEIHGTIAVKKTIAERD